MKGLWKLRDIPLVAAQSNYFNLSHTTNTKLSLLATESMIVFIQNYHEDEKIVPSNNQHIIARTMRVQ